MISMKRMFSLTGILLALLVFSCRTGDEAGKEKYGEFSNQDSTAKRQIYDQPGSQNRDLAANPSGMQVEERLDALEDQIDELKDNFESSAQESNQTLKDEIFQVEQEQELLASQLDDSNRGTNTGYAGNQQFEQRLSDLERKVKTLRSKISSAN